MTSRTTSSSRAGGTTPSSGSTSSTARRRRWCSATSSGPSPSTSFTGRGSLWSKVKAKASIRVPPVLAVTFACLLRKSHFTDARARRDTSSRVRVPSNPVTTTQQHLVTTQKRLVTMSLAPAARSCARSTCCTVSRGQGGNSIDILEFLGRMFWQCFGLQAIHKHAVFESYFWGHYWVNIWANIWVIFKTY